MTVVPTWVLMSGSIAATLFAMIELVTVLLVAFTKSMPPADADAELPVTVALTIEENESAHA